VVIDVADQGPGIPESHLGRIFERFYRAPSDRRSRRATGAGLGLPIAKAIVTGHGGDVSASGRPGNGTVMTIRLPSGVASERPGETAGQLSPLDTAPLRGEAG
jgi:signal transduction histidine kinase